MGRRSGTECAAIVDACGALSLTRAEVIDEARVVLNSIVAMQTTMVRKHSEADEDEDEGADEDEDEDEGKNRRGA